MNKYKYLIKLKPLGSYFIGGENTFGEGKKANYFAKSLLMPQQSTLLGMLRYKILKIHDLLGLKGDTNQIEKLIGKTSFSLEQNLNAPQDFGVIAKLSPLFIYDERESDFYTAMPLDQGIGVSFEKDVDCLWSGKQTRKLPVFDDNFSSKTYDNYQHFVNPDGEKLTELLRDRYKDEKLEVFTHIEQIGITKTVGKCSDNDAFFKQDMIVLHPDLCFACTMETSEEIQEAYCQDLVFMGANRSMFTMNIEASDLDFISSDSHNYFWRLARGNRYLFLSDAYLPDGVFEIADFIWGESVSVRTIQSDVAKGVSWKKPKKSDLYHLQAKGSVLYNDESISKLLSIEGLRKVGLNIFLQPNNTIKK